MVMRRFLVVAALLLCFWQITKTITSAQQSAPLIRVAQDMNFTLEGKITDKAEGKLTVSSGENIIFHVLYNDKTEIKKKDGSPGAPQDLHIGVTISVAGDLAESGEITAKKIDIEAQGSDNKSAGRIP